MCAIYSDSDGELSLYSIGCSSVKVDLVELVCVECASEDPSVVDASATGVLTHNPVTLLMSKVRTDCAIAVGCIPCHIVNGFEGSVIGKCVTSVTS